MKSLTASLLGTALAFGLLLPMHGASAQESCAEGSAEDRVSCLVELVTNLRLEMQRGVADLTIESQRIESKLNTDLRDSKRVIQESIAEVSSRIDSLEIQVGAGLEEVKGEIAGLGASGSLEAMRAEIQKLKGEVDGLKQTVATGTTVTDALRQDVDTGVTTLTDDIQTILTEIQNREASFLATVEGLEARLDGVAAQGGGSGFSFGSGANDNFGEQNTLLLDVTRNSVVFVTVRARVSSLSGGELAITPEAAQHQKCDSQSVGPRVGRNVIMSCTFGGLDSGTIAITGGDKRNENSYSYFVVTPN